MFVRRRLMLKGRGGFPAIVLLLLFIAAALFARAMGASLNHDENQFIASGWLLEKHGLFPYRDYPYFHTPGLVLIYAILFHWTDHLLMTARAFSVVCAWLSGLAVFWLTWRAINPRHPQRFILSVALAALFFTSPVFSYTYFRAWNHALPVLLVLLAIGCHCRGIDHGQPRWFFIAGACVAFAVSCRLSFAPLVLPFVVFSGLVPNASRRVRLSNMAACCGGALLGALPILLSLASSPSEFLFDNFIYNGPINAAYRASRGSCHPFSSRILGLSKLLVHPANLALCGLFIIFALGRPISREGWSRCHARALVISLALAALAGALAATPTYQQYFLIVITLMIVAIGFGLGELAAEKRMFTKGLRFIWIVVAVAAISTCADYRYIFDLATPSGWTCWQVHTQGEAISKIVGQGTVVTLDPITPLEGGLDIDCRLATGPFAWRCTPFLSVRQVAAYHFPSPVDLKITPPAAILVGYDKRLEERWIEYASENGYKEYKLPLKRSLWISPACAVAPRQTKNLFGS